MKMPVLFIGHGSPMIALENNTTTSKWQELGNRWSKPKAILVISAHWYAPYLAITNKDTNQTIHDFYGFPDELSNYDYPSSGSIQIASQISETLNQNGYMPQLTDQWGLDHGVWSILTHMYTKPDMPILQLSIDSRRHPKWHFELGTILSKLREQGVMIICSGNIVHNLSKINMRMPKNAYPWAIAADELLTSLIKKREINQLCNYLTLGDEIHLAIPTPEHYLPVIYALGAGDENSEIQFFNQYLQYGSLSMTSFIIE